MGTHEVILGYKEMVADKGHSEILIPLIEKTLKESNTDVTQIDGFLVCTGPGNYTSLRIAVSTVRGLSLARNKPAIGINLFELLRKKETDCLVIVKGPLDKVYIQKFSSGAKITEPTLISLDELKRMVELDSFTIIGFKAKEVANSVGSIESIEGTKISFEKFFVLGSSQLTLKNQRPVPMYIR